MFRRPRFSVRPKVGTPSKTPQEAPAATPEAGETPKDDGESSAAAAAVTDSQSVVTSPDKPTDPGDGVEQNAEDTGSSAAVQRRKRFSIKPKVAPGRPFAAARMQKTPVKAASETPVETAVEVPVEVPVLDLDKPPTSGQTGTAAAPQRLLSPRRRGSSEDGKQQPKVQPKAAAVSSDGAEPSADSATSPLADGGKGSESGKKSESVKKGVKGTPSKLPDKAPFIIPDREAMELSEKARTLVSSKSRLSMSAPAFSLSRLLNDPSDLQRIAKAQKLRDLLRQEMHKEKKLKKGNTRVQELTLDRAKMTMRDLIHYLPRSNPMTSSLEEPAQENETVIPPSPAREASLENVKEPVVLPKIGSPKEVEEEEGEERAPGEEDEDEDEEDGTMVPRVKVAEDGTLIIDEESLTVEVLRAKGPNPAHGRDPIFERGSTTTYSSFRKGTYTKPWSSEETDMFFLAISMVGTDFSMICHLFPLRTRSEIKNKFKKEERENSWRIDKAFRERRKLDIEYFTKLLEKILEVNKTRKKLKSLAAKNSRKKTTREPRGKKAAASAEEEEEEEEEEEDENGEDEIVDLMEEGEKENEEVRSEGGGGDATKPKKKRKRKSKEDEGPGDKKNKAAEKSSERDDACVPGDAEAALPEVCPTSDMCEETESVTEATGAKIKPAKIKPAKLSRGRAPKPAVSKPPPASTKTAAAAQDEEDPSVSDGDAEDKVNKDASSPVSQAEGKKSPTEDSEEEDAVVRPQRPTRSGRVPKPVQLLNYAAKEAAASGAAGPASPEGSSGRPKPKSASKRGRPAKLQSSQESKKPKLVTLRASQSEYSDEEEEDEKQRGGGEEEEQEDNVEEEECPAWGASEDGTAPVFVPASLRSPRPVIPEVEETMEELDILAHIPDVLGISQNETGTSESCEHQLDLLVDVIDYLSADPTEVSENESYNEAAQTLLTIGNISAHLSPSDHAAGTTSTDVNETSLEHLEEEIAAKPAVPEEADAATSPDHKATETSAAVPVVEPPSNTTDNDDVSVVEPIDRTTAFETEPPLKSPESSTTNPPQTRVGRASKLKPKPNLGPASRTAQPKLPPGRRAEKSRDVARTTETLSVAEESLKIADKNMLKEDISSIEVKRAEEPERSAGEVQSDAATSGQSAPENQQRCVSEARLEPGAACRDSGSTSGPTEEAPTPERSCDDPVTPDTALAEPRGSNERSAPAQESGGHVAAPVEDSPVNQKEEESKAESTQPVRKSRFQKIKPKLNLAQASRTPRCQPQTTRDAAEKDSQPAPPNPQTHQETTAEVQPSLMFSHASPEPTRTESPTKTSRGPDLASDSTPFMNLRWTLAPTGEPLTTEEETADVGVAARSESDAATSHQQNVPQARSTPGREPVTRDTTLTLESLGGAKRSRNDPEATSDSVATETLARGSNMASGDHLVAPAKEKGDAASTFQSPRRRLQKVKPKPNVPQTSRTARSKPPTAKDSETPKSRTPGSESTDDVKAVAEAPPTCSAAPPEETSQIKSSGELRSTPETPEETSSCEAQKPVVASEPNVPQRRQRFARLKPTLASSPRPTRAKLQSHDVSKPPVLGHVDTPSSSEPDLASTLGSQHFEAFSPTKSVSTVSEASQAEHSSPSSLTITEYWGAENWSQYTDLVLENMCSKEEEEEEGAASLGDRTANSEDVEAGPAAQGGHDPDGSVGATESDIRPADDPIAASDVKSSKSILPTSTRPSAASKESARQPPAQAECEAAATAAAALSPDANQQRSDTDQTAAQSSDVHPSEPTDSPSREAPQARRGRLVKPKPLLVRRGRPPQARQVQNAKQAETDVAAGSEVVDAERRPDIPDPAEGAVEQSRNQHSSPKEAGSSLGRLTHVPGSSPRDSSSPSAGATQSLCMSSQELSDPDEQFFILSLTEIPVSTLSEPTARGPEPLLCLSVTDAPIQQQSAPGEAALPRIPAEESVEAGARTTQPGRIAENPVQAETSTVHASKSPETPELKDESETPAEQPGGAPAARRRRAKEPPKPKTAKRKPAGKTTKTDVDQETPAGGADPEDGGSGQSATRTRATRSQDGKPKGFPSVTSATGDAAIDAPAGRAASKARTPRAAGKRAAAPTTSTPRSSSSSAPPTHTPETPDTPEVSAAQDSEFGEEEPTSVSQYFLSDIFTDVEG